MSAAKSVTATFNLIPVTYTLTVRSRRRERNRHVDPGRHQLRRRLLRGLRLRHVGHPHCDPDLRLRLRGLERSLHRDRRLPGHDERGAESVTATFALAMYTLTVTTAGTGSGTVTSSPAGISCGADCSEPYNRGTVVSLTATAATGSSFGGWTGPAPEPGPAR